MWIGSLDGAVSKALLEGVSQTMYANGHLLFVRERTLMAQPFEVTRLETAGDAFPAAENIQTGTGGNSAFSVAPNGLLVYQAGMPRTTTISCGSIAPEFREPRWDPRTTET